MRNEFTAVVEEDGPWFIAYCAEVPGANGQGETREEGLANLREAISMILDYRRGESLRTSPPESQRELGISSVESSGNVMPHLKPSDIHRNSTNY